METTQPSDTELLRDAFAAMTRALDAQTQATLRVVEAFTRPPEPFFPPELVAALGPMLAAVGHQVGQVLAAQMQPQGHTEQPARPMNGDGRKVEA